MSRSEQSHWFTETDNLTCRFWRIFPTENHSVAFMLLAAGLQLPFLGELVAGTAIAYLCYRLRLEPVVGFLLAGVLVGFDAGLYCL